jgi:Gas vesicle protein
MAQVVHHNQASTLADVLDRILDKGVVVAGDISISLVGVELLTIRIRLLIASVDKAREMGISWWETDRFLNGQTRGLEDQNRALADRVVQLETHLSKLLQPGETMPPMNTVPQSKAPAATAARGPRRSLMNR